MKAIQLLQITRDELNLPIFNYIDKKFENLEKLYQPKEPTQFITRQYVADEILHCDLSTVHNLTKKGILQKYQCGGRILYKREEVESAIVKLNR